MAEASYTLVFGGGILSGFEREQVMQRFGQLFRASAADVETIFGHPRVVLKRNLDRAAADAYMGRLRAIGMAVSLDTVHPPADAATAETAPSPVVRAAAVSQPGQPAEEESVVPASMAARPRAEAADQASASDAARQGREAASAFVAAPTPVADATDEPRELAFEFSGNGFEFFRIWIVNLLLSIVTLGIYSAWAKVRTQRYFYGNTRCAGASFEYLADPLNILKGRLIAFALLVLYLLADKFAPPLRAALALVFSLIFPWVMVRGLAFRNRNSAWRGVRFGFDGRFGEAYRVFALWPFVGVLSLGLLFPYAVYRQQQFVIENSRYGTESFHFEARPRGFYMIALVLTGVAVGGFLLTGFVGAVLPLLTPLAVVAVYLVIFVLSSVMFTNLRYNNAALGAHGLRADYRVGSYTMLMLTNMVGIGLTLGLFYPWAKVRSARYAARHIAFVADGDPGEFAAAQREEISALGGEIGEMFDVDLGL